MRDFTLSVYQQLLTAFHEAGYSILSFGDYIADSSNVPCLILRHDVDEKAFNALKMARIEHTLGIRSTFFFRMVKQSNVPEVIQEIVKLGHEIGYHYEDLSSANGDMERAIDTFSQNLNYFRQYYPIKSVCMHGSSTSPFDNRLIWSRYRLEDFGLIGEPYISTRFDTVFYLSDVGLGWDGDRFAVRDVVESSFNQKYHSTFQIIASLKDGTFPEQAMLLAHTLWADSFSEWCFLHLREYCRNHVKLWAKKSKVISTLYGFLVNHYWKKT